MLSIIKFISIFIVLFNLQIVCTGPDLRRGGIWKGLNFLRGGGRIFAFRGGGYLERLKFLSLSNLLHSKNFKGGGGKKREKMRIRKKIEFLPPKTLKKTLKFMTFLRVQKKFAPKSEKV